MKRVIALNSLYTFVVTSLSFLVPLYLLDRNVPIETVGFLVALGPLTFAVLRVVFASIADEVGTLSIGLLYSISSAASVLTYMFVPTSPGFVFAGMLGGVHNSAFWAVVRTDTLAAVKGDAGKALAYVAFVRQFADGISRLAIGFVLAYLAFQGAFALLFAVSLALLVLLLIKRDSLPLGVPDGRRVIGRIFKKRPDSFWNASAVLAALWLSLNVVSGFLLPVYLVKGVGMGYQQAGILLGAFSLAIAVASLASMRMDRRALVIGIALMVPALAAIPFFGAYLLPLLLVVAFGSGCANVINEYILAEQVYGRGNVSADIGAIFTPLKVGEFALLSASGFMIAMWGFQSVFAACALSVAVFAVAMFLSPSARR